jgi:hypothetical protein
MADEIVWYRAETAGFVGHEGDIGPDYYCYATSDLNAARAYAAIREHRSGVGRSVYRVELLAEAEPDPDYWKFPQFIRCLSVMLAEVVEARPTMTPEEGTKYMCDTYSPWPEDGTTPGCVHQGGVRVGPGT